MDMRDKEAMERSITSVAYAGKDWADLFCFVHIRINLKKAVVHRLPRRGESAKSVDGTAVFRIN
jgi:hypothetical protein